MSILSTNKQFKLYYINPIKAPNAKLVLLSKENFGKSAEQISTEAQGRYKLMRVSYASANLLFAMATMGLMPNNPAVVLLAIPVSFLWSYRGLLGIHLSRSILPMASVSTFITVRKEYDIFRPFTSTIQQIRQFYCSQVYTRIQNF